MVREIDIVEQEADTDEMFEDFKQTFDDEDERRYRPSRNKRKGRPIFLWVIGIVVVLGLLTLIFRSWENGSPKNPDSLEAQIKALQQSVSKLEETDMSLRDQIEGLNQKIDKALKTTPPRTAEKTKPAQPVVQKKTPPPVEKIKTVQPVVQQKTTAKADARFHEVKAGESLFQIAKKYGITVDKLRQLNKLNEKQPITPGQKLLVR